MGAFWQPQGCAPEVSMKPAALSAADVDRIVDHADRVEQFSRCGNQHRL
jgi:hypothetical protein